MTAALDRAFAFTQECLGRFGYVSRNDLHVRAVRAAVVTPRSFGPDRGYTGAAYDGVGALIPESLRFNQGDINPVDPPELPAGMREAAGSPRRLGIYAGSLFPILGHFVFETLARLWPLAHLHGGGGTEPADIVVHEWPGLELPAFFDNTLYRALFDTLGITPDRLVLADFPLSYETLLVADPASRYHADMNMQMDDLLMFMRRSLLGTDAPPLTGDRLYLSRSRWGSNRRVVNEAEVDQVMAARGYKVVHPEALPPTELAGFLAGASIVVSFDGSHAHLAAFCEPETATVLFDTRPVPTQIAIAKLRGFRIMHVPLFEMPELYREDAGVLDPSGLCSMAEQAIRERLIAA